MGERHKFTPEDVAKAARVRNENRRARKANPMLAVNDELPDLISDLLDAARGRGAYASLPPEKRLVALLKAIEYGAGRPPTAGKAPEAPSEEPKEVEGVSIT